jgi:hypothetical protein
LTDDPGHKPRAAPKLDRRTFENLVGFFDSFAVVCANKEPVPDKTNLGPDEIGPVIQHAFFRGAPPDGKKLRPNGGR